MANPTITWGCDPEFFGLTKDGDKLVKSYDYPVGDKGKSAPIEGMEDWGVLADGCTFEFNTTRVYDNPVTMRDDLFTAVEAVEEKYGIWMDYGRPFIHVPTEWWGDTQINTIGCDPDQCAVQHGKHRRRLTPEDFVTKQGQVWRGAGCHIHIGIDPWPEIPKHAFIRLLDALYNNIWHMPAPSDLTCKYRRMGLYRSKPYGVEYRTPGHEWIKAEADTLYLLETKVRDLVEILSNTESQEFNALVGIYQQINAEDQARLALDRGSEMYYVGAAQRIAFWGVMTKYEQKKMREMQDAIIANAGRDLHVAAGRLYAEEDLYVRNPE